MARSESRSAIIAVLCVAAAFFGLNALRGWLASWPTSELEAAAEDRPLELIVPVAIQGRRFQVNPNALALRGASGRVYRHLRFAASPTLHLVDGERETYLGRFAYT